MVLRSREHVPIALESCGDVLYTQYPELCTKLAPLASLLTDLQLRNKEVDALSRIFSSLVCFILDFFVKNLPNITAVIPSSCVSSSMMCVFWLLICFFYFL